MSETHGDRWFYHPTQTMYASPVDEGLAFESVRFRSDSATLHGWFFPALHEAKGTVIHCHGNGGNITGHFRHIAWLPARGWNVLAFDYRGFGKSDGHPTREGTIHDAHAAIDYMRTRADVDADRLVLFGQSLGGAVAIVAAADRTDLRGVATEGAFQGYQAAAQYLCRTSWWLWGVTPLCRWLVGAGFDPIDHVARVAPTPLFFIAGTADDICDYRQTVNLHDRASEPKSLWLIEDGAHTGALTDTNGEGPRRLEAFFAECVAGAP